MIRHIVLLILTFILFKSFNLSAQKAPTKKQFTADSIFIYKGFKKHGTTANLWHYHRDLDNTKTEKIKLDTKELNEFIEIFKDVKGKKLFQQKYGGDIYYAIVYSNGLKKTYVFMTYYNFARIDNLIDMRFWQLKDTTKTRQFNNLLKKYCP